MLFSALSMRHKEKTQYYWCDKLKTINSEGELIILICMSGLGRENNVADEFIKKSNQLLFAVLSKI
jgi:hypothetical protein